MFKIVHVEGSVHVAYILYIIESLSNILIILLINDRSTNVDINPIFFNDGIELREDMMNTFDLSE